MPNARRVLIYLLYDPEGKADLSVLSTLSAFRSVAHRILVVSNGTLTPDAQAKLAAVADNVVVRENTGFDVGAYQAGLAVLGREALKEYDELILANSTFFSATDSFLPLFQQMQTRAVDFWGMTDHPAITPHPYTGEGIMHAHLQTYWLVFRKRLLSDPDFLSYWDALPIPETYEQVVTSFETELSHHFATRGFKWCAAYPAEDFGVDNPTMQAPAALLDAGCPVVKKRLYFHGTQEVLELGVSVAQVTAKALEKGLTREVIADGVLRRSDAAQASIALGALYVVPAPDQTDLLGETHGRTPLPTKMRHQRPWRALALQQEQLPEQDTLLIVAPSSMEPVRGDGEIWRRTSSLRAVTENPGHLASLLRSEPKLGMLVPTLQFLGNAEQDTSWVPQARKARRVATALGLEQNLGSEGPICAYQGIAAYRTQALRGFGERIRNAGGWRELAKLAGGEKRLDLILDQLVADHMLQQGYYAGQVTSEIELRTEAPLWMVEAQANFAQYRGYSEYLRRWKTLTAALPRGQVAWIRTELPFVYPVMEFTQRRAPTLYLALNRLYTKAHIEIAARRHRG